jgi:hypothetical protein
VVVVEVVVPDVDDVDVVLVVVLVVVVVGSTEVVVVVEVAGDGAVVVASAASSSTSGRPPDARRSFESTAALHAAVSVASSVTSAQARLVFIRLTVVVVAAREGSPLADAGRDDRLRPPRRYGGVMNCGSLRHTPSDRSGQELS